MRSGLAASLVVSCCLLLMIGVITVQAQSTDATQLRMWDTVDASDWTLMVRSVERLRDPLPGENANAPVRAQGQFVVLVVDLTNRAANVRAPATNDFLLSSAEGGRWHNVAKSVAARTYAETRGLTPFGDPVSRGASIRTIVLFDVDFPATQLALHWLPLGTQPIRIDECHCNLPSPRHAMD